MNWLLIIIMGILLIALIVFLAWRNLKDEKELEAELKDYPHHSKEKEEDLLLTEVLK